MYIHKQTTHSISAGTITMYINESRRAYASSPSQPRQTMIYLGRLRLPASPSGDVMSRAKLDLADFHIGNLTDFWSLSYTLDKAVAKLRKYGIGRVDLVLLGDIHDYQNMYPTQVSLTKGVWQAYGAAGLVDWMVEKLKSRGVSVDKIVIVEDNHDRRLHEGISLTGYLVQAYEEVQGSQNHCRARPQVRNS